MRTSKFLPQLKRLFAKPVFTAEEARAQAIPARMLSHFCHQGMIERMGRGVYRTVSAETNLDFSIEDFVLTALTIPKGVVCLISALCLYELTDQLMREYWIAIPNQQKKPIRNLVRIVRMRNISLGQTKMKIGEFEISVFDRERTVVDAFRFLSDEIAIKALQAYIRSPTQKADLVKLSQYAKQLRVNITPYMMALTT